MKSMFKIYKPNETTCNSGGAIGSDTIWEICAESHGMLVNAFSYQTKSHKSKNKVEISDEDYEEGISKIKKANKTLGRKNIDKYLNLLARNWAQVKYSEEVFAIGKILRKGDISSKGYKITSNIEIVDGGTGYAVQMAIDSQKTVYVFDQELNNWFKWSYILDCFVRVPCTPIIQCKKFAGIGTREINENGKKAILNVFADSFKIS